MSKPAWGADRAIMHRGALFLLLLFAFAIRISGLTAQSLWRDEVDALRFSQAPLASLASNFTRPGWNGPLFYVLLRGWVACAGSSEFSMRYISLLWSVLGVAMLYRLGRSWFLPPADGPTIAGVASLLMASAPYMVWYAQEAKMYAMLPTLVIATLYLYHRALRDADWRLWPAVIVLTWITAGVHVIGALLVPLMAVLLVVWWPLARGPIGRGTEGRVRAARGRSVRQALLALACGALPMLAALPWAWPLLVRGASIGHHFKPLPEMAVTTLYAFGRGIASAGGLWPVGLALFFLLAGTFLWSGGGLHTRLQALMRRRWDRVGEGAYVCAAWAWLAVPLLGLYAISTRVPLFVDRYLIWTGPALYLLMARGYEQLRRRSVLLAAVCLVAFLGLNGWALWEQSATPFKSDFRAAAAHVRQHRQPGELVLFHISYVRETFEYYYGDASPAADGVPTDGQTTPEAVDAAMRARTAGHEVVWLVLSEPEMWDARGMTVAWLDEHGVPDMRADFARVSVIRYRMANAKDRPRTETHHLADRFD